MKAIVVTPTYNEKENIRELIENILEVHASLDVIIVDDYSPDGTAQIVEELSIQSKRVHLIKRKGARGRGYADILGMQFAIKEGYDYIIQMDADFSHDPKYLPEFLKAIESHDVVIGSRLVAGGKILGRNPYRNFVTRLANGYIRLILGLKVKDCTSGYRCYRRGVLASLELDKMFSPGPSLLEETLYACHKKGYDLFEIPFVFSDRRKGKSKLTFKELAYIFWLVFKIRLKK